MKKLLLFLIVFASLTVKAQTPKNFTQTADSCLINLDKSGVTTGILYDRVFPFAALAIFNQNYADTSSYSHFKQGYNELYDAAYSNGGMMTPDNFNQQISDKINNGIYPIGILNYRFNYLDTMAVENNLIYNNGLLMYDVPNRTSSPYIERLLSLGAVLADSITTGTPYFELSSSLYLNNTGNAIANVNVDFADGTGLHQLGLGQGIGINYSSGGFKTIHYYINYTNGQQVETYSSVYVIISSIASSQKVMGTPNSPLPPCNGFDAPEVLPTIVADLSYQGYENESSPIIGQGQATIIYHTNNCDRVLHKPIIILDGFDPGSQHKLKYLHDHLVYNVGNNFGEEMLAKGYDIIFMDYPDYYFNGTHIDGGSDYIQRNAFTLIKLIQKVNKTLQDNGSTEQLVVVGPSMGGLISRYALAYMEHNNMPHNTRLWVSFDSPHLGANIPIGDQWVLDYLGNALHLTPAKDKLNLNINTAAAKEMLLHHYLTNTESPAPYWTRNSFMQELNNLGFPSQLRKIALINGSGNGTQLGNFGDMDLHLGVQPTVLIRVIVGVGTYFIPFKSLFMKVVKSIAQAAGVNIELTKSIDAQAWYTPGYNGRNQVFHGELLGWLVKRTRYASTYSNSIGLDNSMGGYYNAQQQIADGFKEGFPGFIKPFFKPTIFTLLPNHSFIPAKSSLAVTNGSNFGEDFSTRNLVTTTETPFDSYFTPNTNEDHVSLTACSALWLSNEIDQQPQPPAIAVKYAIYGASSICNSQNSYTINGLPAGTTVTWSANPTNIVNISVNNNTATLTPIGNGSINLSATVTSACGSTIVTMPVIVGSQEMATISSTLNGSCSNGSQTWYLQATTTSSVATNWQWTVETPGSGTYYFSAPNSPNTFVTVKGGGYVNVTFVNGCGITSAKSGVFIYSPCRSAGAIVAYPNPANNAMTVQYTTASNSRVQSAAVSSATDNMAVSNSFSVELYNDKGKVLKSGKSGNGNGVVLDTADIPNGNYFLHVKDGKEVIKKQVVIQH